MDTSSWAQIALVCLAGAISPGPSLALIISNTITRGSIHGIFTSIGHAAGIGLWSLLTVIGIAEVITDKPEIMLLLRFFGSGLLVYLGLQMILHKQDAQSEDSGTPEPSRRPLLRDSMEGLLMSLLNPKIALFFIAIFSHFVHTEWTWAQTSLVATSAAVIDASWYIAVSITVGIPGSISFLRAKRMVAGRVSGSILVLMGLYLMATTVLAMPYYAV